MPQTKIQNLTPEQEALISVYREKWRNIAFSTDPIDKEKAASAIKEIYALCRLGEPEIFFCQSPDEAMNTTLPQLDNLINQLKTVGFSHLRLHISKLFSRKKRLDLDNVDIKKQRHVTREIQEKFAFELFSSYMKNIEEQLQNKIAEYLELQIDEDLDIELCNQMRSRLGKQYNGNFIHPVILCSYCSWFDFFNSVLNYDGDKKISQAFQNLAQSCGWIFPYKNVAVVCSRPLHLGFDDKQQLHGEGEPAIQFADGYSLYSYHGVTLPEKYGKLHPNEWEAKWLLEENNAELRRVLIQGIGYSRIIEELQATELDSYQEYRLLKIDNEVDVEPIYLLKMVCPSTGFIHVLRVPPSVKSAREAICWVNWGVAPEDFAVQT
ncbi:MAG: DUF6745 domain-containing protein [Heteroscytonema crispum UTEX LB 1556]